MSLRFFARFAAVLILLSASALSLRAQQRDCPVGVIETIAGGGVGDGGPATEAAIDDPDGVAVDADGSLYIADTDHHRIRKVEPTGIITTVVGTGAARFSGDGGPAAQAALDRPSALAIASDGSLYIADTGNHRIRKVDPKGIITTVAGDGSGDAGGRVSLSGDGRLATQAGLRYPRGIALGPEGSLYIADTGNHRIRRVGPDGIITTVAGNGDPGYSDDGGPAVHAALREPAAVAVGPDGDLYIADTGNHRIRAVAPGGAITTLAGDGYATGRSRGGRFRGDGGPATEASLNRPQDVVVDAGGTIYIADTYNNRLRTVGRDGIISTVAGSGERGDLGDGGPAARARLLPTRLALAPDGTLFITEAGRENRVRKIQSLEGRVARDAIITTVAGNGARGYCGDGGPATAASLDWPWAVAPAPDGSFYIADGRNNRVRKVDPVGVITTFAGTGERGDSGDGGPAAAAAFNRPGGFALAPDGSLYIADSENHRIRKVGPDGVITTVAGDGWKDRGGGGRFGGDGGPATEASLDRPYGIALGPDGALFVTDHNNHRIRRVDPAGIITTVAGTGDRRYSGDGGPAIAAALNWPYAVAAAPDGSLYIADSRNHRVRKVDTDGIITTVAGSDEPGYTGDGGPAAEARINRPMGLAVGPDGDLYIGEAGGDRIRRVDPSGTITTVAGGGYRGSWDHAGIATDAQLRSPFGLAIGADGALYFADGADHRVRRIRWLPCDPEAAAAAAADLRDAAGDSSSRWREVAELYLIAGAWRDALAAAERLIALAPEADQSAEQGAQILAARINVAGDDDHAARRRLIPVLARVDDPAVLRGAAGLLVDIYLRRDERHQAIATLNDLRLRTHDPGLIQWVDQRLKGIVGD